MSFVKVPDDMPKQRVRIRCGCGNTFVTEVPQIFEKLETVHLCPSCQKPFFMEDGVLRREDGTVLGKKGAKMKETTPSADSFPVAPNKWVN